MLISIIVPVFNEGAGLRLLYDGLNPILTGLNIKFEVILIDDGSEDETSSIIVELNKKNLNWKGITLARNFGQQSAITAGLDIVKGDAVIVMDADLQDPPECIERMLEKWREGFQVVFMKRTKRKESFFKKMAYFSFYWLINKITYPHIQRDSGDFALMDRKVIEAIKLCNERSRFVRGLRSWVGFKQIGIEYDRPLRKMGMPKYTLKKLFTLAFDGLFSFSYLPLRLFIMLGFFITFLSSVYLIIVVYLKVIGYYDKSNLLGWTSIVSLITFFSGFQILALGLTGEYIGRIFIEAKKRPIYIEASRIGFNSES